MQRLRALTLSSALLASSLAYAVNPPNFNAWFEEEAASPPRPAKSPAAAWAFATSFDTRRGTPTFLRASSEHPMPPEALRKDPETAARWYLQQHAGRYGLTARAVEDAEVARVHDTGEGGIIVNLRQRMDGIEVFRTEVKVLMRRNLELVAISGSLHRDAVGGRAIGRLAFQVPAPDAVSYALEDLYGVSIDPAALKDTGRRQGDYRYYDLRDPAAMRASGLRFTEPTRAKRVFFPRPEGLVPAWFMELVVGRSGTTQSDTFAYVVAADDGRVLLRENLTYYDGYAYQYRVWADDTWDQVPADSPLIDYSPHPSGQPDGIYPGFTLPVVVTADAFHTSLDGGIDPWLASNATTLTGNNVDAYADHNSPDGYSEGDVRATLTGERAFDRFYDTGKEPLEDEDQVMAAITQLFYVNNWLHSWYYDSGFDETAGNAQSYNYGRGGFDGDPMLAEAQDGYLAGSRNNANMSARSDGASPRMQMFVWSGYDVRHFETLGKDMATGTAAFGPTDFDFNAQVVLAEDGVDTTNDACTAITNNVRGKIALIDRGTCTFKIKALSAEAAGAIGVIIADNRAASTPPGMANGDPVDAVVTIPVLSILQADGVTIKAALNPGPVNARMSRATGVEHDGTIDNQISAHEWGHFIHHRLVECSIHQCRGQSEGWGDFLSLHMTVREGDDYDGTYGMASYAGVSGTNSAYYGIRRYPYSTDFTKNPLTFRHIQTGEPLPADVPHATGPSDNAEVHNTGEIWTTMMWEGYAALLKETEGASPRLSYEEARRRMSDYLVAGMKLAPLEPTFTDQRDALLAAIAARDMQDFQVFAEAFARRGAGTCAVSPPREGTDNKGVEESFELSPDLAIVGLELTDDSASCDQDGYLDAGETATVTMRIINTGAMPLAGTLGVLSSTMEGVSFPKGATIGFGELQPFEVGTATLQVRLDPGLTGFTLLDLAFTASNDSSCARSVVHETMHRVNFDDVPETSATDDVESERSLWTEQIDLGGRGLWSRIEVDPSSHYFHGLDPSSMADVSLVSPALEVRADQDFVIGFKHRYEFETGPAEEGGEDVYWDGGVVEISADHGKTWRDVRLYGEVPYNGVIGDLAGNPLRYRPAFVAVNPSSPEWDRVSIDLGQAFAGQTVHVRFRIGTDPAAGGNGWEIDDISFQGLANLPFSSLVPDRSDVIAWYRDEDGDGKGAGEPLLTCDTPEGYVRNADDCDDQEALASTGLDEQCDGVDNDCDGEADESPTDGATWFSDADEDGYGDAASSTVACAAPEGYVSDDTDCDDTDGEVSPAGSERCDGVDNDCDGEIDEDAADVATFYADSDGDGHGDSSEAVSDCEAPRGYVSSDDDCDDGDSRTYPGAGEACDGVDNDCDGATDEEVTVGMVFYLDADGDGQGSDGDSVTACGQPEGYVTNDLDCDDDDAASYIGADEVCDEADNDCDGEIDDDAADAMAFYPDGDGDGFGANVDPVMVCSQPDTYVTNDDDCDDANAATYPGAPEDGSDFIDHDCDGEVIPAATPEPGDDDDDDDDDSGDGPGGCSQAGGRGYAGSLLPWMALLLAGGVVRRRRPGR